MKWVLKYPDGAYNRGLGFPVNLDEADQFDTFELATFFGAEVSSELTAHPLATERAGDRAAEIEARYDRVTLRLKLALGMLKKYVDIVGQQEGVSFLYDYDWTFEERVLWLSIDPKCGLTMPVTEGSEPNE